MSKTFINVLENATDHIRIQSYAADSLTIQGHRHHTSLFLSVSDTPEPYEGTPFPTEEWFARHLARLEHQDVILIGAGAQIAPATYQQCYQFWSRYRLVVDVMNTAAACRTFNLLSEEGRQVSALLLLPDRCANAAAPA